MLKYNPCIYGINGYSPCYPRFRFGNYSHFAYAPGALCCTLVLSSSFLQRRCTNGQHHATLRAG